jgi:hypothetical protein
MPLTPLAAAACGAAILWWVAGSRLIDPREIGWVMHGDWQIHFLGWHFFRHEPWQWPPGAIRSMLEPIGTSIGFTDSIPLLAFALKPFSAWLPNPMQYLGLWFLICYALQAFFGALVIAAWTPRAVLQFGGALFFFFMPALFHRVGHPALSAHWLLLWALWLNWRKRPQPGNDIAHHAALGLTAGLVHPYLAAMTLALLAAVPGRRIIEARTTPVSSRPSLASVVAPLAMSVIAVLAGWWASGLFTLRATQDLAAAGSNFSMNLLSPFNPGPGSFFLPGFSFLSPDQFDSYQYLGVGGLLLCVIALTVAIVRRPSLIVAVPLLVVLGACSVYAVTPVVAAGSTLLLDLSDELGDSRMFRATGRFFWPVAYALLAAAIGVIATQLKPRVATAVLLAALAIQLVDLHQWWLRVHHGSRDPAFHAWDMPLKSSEWHHLLPRYKRVHIYPPGFCQGAVPALTTAAAYLAGLYGLGLNDGYTARVDSAAQAAACRKFSDDFTRGFIADDTVYLLARPLVPEFHARLGEAAVCRELDLVTVCVSRRSEVR